MHGIIDLISLFHVSSRQNIECAPQTNITLPNALMCYLSSLYIIRDQTRSSWLKLRKGKRPNHTLAVMDVSTVTLIGQYFKFHNLLADRANMVYILLVGGSNDADSHGYRRV